MTSWADMTTDNRITSVLAGVKDKKTYSQMALMFDTSRSAVSGVINRIRANSPELLAPAQNRGVAQRRGNAKRIVHAQKNHVVDSPKRTPGILRPPQSTAPKAPIAPVLPQRIASLNDYQCRFAVAGPSNDGHWFCAASCEKNTPYCEAHSERARLQYQPKNHRRYSNRKALSHG